MTTLFFTLQTLFRGCMNKFGTVHESYYYSKEKIVQEKNGTYLK